MSATLVVMGTRGTLSVLGGQGGDVVGGVTMSAGLSSNVENLAGVAVAPSRRYVAPYTSTAGGGQLAHNVYDLDTSTTVLSTGTSRLILDAQFSPDGALFALCGAWGVEVYSTSSWALVFDDAVATNGLAFSHDSAWLAAVRQTAAAGCQILRTADWGEEHAIVLGTAFQRAVFSADRARIALTGGGAPHIRVYETATWTVISTFATPSFLSTPVTLVTGNSDLSTVFFRNAASVYISKLSDNSTTRFLPPTSREGVLGGIATLESGAAGLVTYRDLVGYVLVLDFATQTWSPRYTGVEEPVAVYRAGAAGLHRVAGTLADEAAEPTAGAVVAIDNSGFDYVAAGTAASDGSYEVLMDAPKALVMAAVKRSESPDVGPLIESATSSEVV